MQKCLISVVKVFMVSQFYVVSVEILKILAYHIF